MTTIDPGFEVIARADVPESKHGRPRNPRWAAICEAALANPEAAIRVRGLTAAETHALRQQQFGHKTAFRGRVKVAMRKQSDGTYECFVTAVQS